MCMAILLTCVPVPMCLRRPEDIGSPVSDVIASCEVPCEYWKLNPGLL